MWSSLTSQTFHLATVKPLKGLRDYRATCLASTRAAIADGAVTRTTCLADGADLDSAGTVEGLPYVRCGRCGSHYLRDVAESAAWANAVAQVTRARHAMDGVHARLTAERVANVYQPKLAWIENTLRLQGLQRASVLELEVAPSDLTALLLQSQAIAEVVTSDELTVRQGGPSESRVDAAVLLESLDRSDDPVRLLEGVARRIGPGGLVFVTALVSTGFDMASLGLGNQYLYPPDRANCFSLDGLSTVLERCGLSLLEVSTPGVLDVQIVQSHLDEDPTLPLSTFERQLLASPSEVTSAFQEFLQEYHLSSFARIVGRKIA
jgi:hypothetical protein